MSAGTSRAAASGPGLAAAIFDFSRGKQALLTIAQPALGVVLALGGLPSWRVIAIGLPAAAAASFALYALNDLLDFKIDAQSRLRDREQGLLAAREVEDG